MRSEELGVIGASTEELVIPKKLLTVPSPLIKSQALLDLIISGRIHHRIRILLYSVRRTLLDVDCGDTN